MTLSDDRSIIIGCYTISIPLQGVLFVTPAKHPLCFGGHYETIHFIIADTIHHGGIPSFFCLRRFRKRICRRSAEPAVSREHLDPKPATEEVEVSIDSTKPKITDVLLSELNSKLASNQVIPEFTSKSEAIPAHQIGKNMKVAIIPGNYTNSYDQLLCEQFVAAAKSAGIKETTVAETDGTISTINEPILKQPEGVRTLKKEASTN